MFCSNCGKTIRLEDGACQHCGASLGEGLFYGNTYTSCQVRIPAESINNAPEGGMMFYTRTSYMSEQPKDNVYSNTVYRPLLSDEEDLDRIEAEEAAAAAEEEAARRAEEEAARAEEAVPEEEAAPEAEEEPAFEEEIPAEEPAAEDDEEFSDEDFEEEEDIPAVSTSPLPTLKKAAISPRVLSYMEELEKQQERRASGGGLRMPSFLNKLNLKKKAAEPEEELPEAEDIPQAEEAFEETYEEPAGDVSEETAEETGEDFAEEESAPAEDEEVYAEGEETYAGDEAAEELPDDGEPLADADYDGETGDAGEYVSDDESFDSYEDEDEDAVPEKKFDLSGLFAGFDFKALLQNRILKISVAAILIIAVLIGGVVWLNYVTTKRAKIVDVTYSAYSQGIELLKQHVGEEYRTSMTQVYMTNTGTANQHFAEDMAKFNMLIPAEPAANDPLFVTTLTIVQDAIVDAIKADADAELNGKAAERAAISERDWLAIEDAISKIENARTPNELSAIVGNLESIVVPTASPTPAPTPDNRKTLTKGMMDDVDVRYMQNKLINLGFLEGEADGDFGAGTETAVKAFQRAAGLTADGVVTPAVLDAMEAPDAPHAPSSAAPSNPSAE